MTAETLPAVLHEAAAAFGEDEAVVQAGRRVSFRELDQMAQRVARALVASGVTPGERVAVWAANSVDWIAASFGVYAAGAVLVPLNKIGRAHV